jgi:hypothetical protein
MKRFSILICTALFMSCTHTPEKKEHQHDVGFPPKNKTTVLNPNFEACDSSKTYYYYNQQSAKDRSAYFQGGAKAIKRHLHATYPELDLGKESGMFTIHFMLNCKGEIDHFQFVENDLDYRPKKFPSHVKETLFEAHQTLEGWQPIYINGAYRDCYMHTTYILKNGTLENVLP